MATGHSFRTRKPRELILYTSDAYQVTSVFQDERTAKRHRTGLQRDRSGAVSLRLDYEDVKKQSDIALLLPIKALTPDSHKLVQGGPDERRQFLDWGLFHVEHSFLKNWKNYKRALSQRNELLRNDATNSEIELWNQPFIEAATLIHQARVQYMDALKLAFSGRLSTLNVEFPVDLSYRPGSTEPENIKAVLQKNLQHHRRMKTTTDGPHRADLLILTNDLLSKQVLSRGQQKVLVYLLHLAQLDVMESVNTTKTIVICDDLNSELDPLHCSLLVNQLEKLGNQVFISGVDLSTHMDKSHQRFHMEHGELKKGL